MSVALLGSVAASGGGGGSYVAPAVSFDVSTFLTNAALTATDNGTFSYSLWVKVTALVSPHIDSTFWVSDPDNAANNGYAELSGGNALNNLYLTDNVASTFQIRNAGVPLTDAWFNVMGSIDVSGDSGSRISKTYINDAAAADTIIHDDGPGFVIPFNGKSLLVGAGGYGVTGNFLGGMADAWFAPGVSLLDGGGDIPVATRRLFIDAGGKPVNPSGFPASAVLLSGNASTFATNRGSGGAFTTTGMLTNASTSPSD
jgi:hypothetical protein